MSQAATSSPTERDGPVIACVSTLADEAVPAALPRTLSRLASCSELGAIAVLCWEDQAREAARHAGDAASVVPVGPRGDDPAISLVKRSQAWADGWRGGPLATCSPDRGWHARAVQAVAEATDAGLVYAVDACFGCLDPELSDAMVRHAIEQAEASEPVTFTPGPAGLTGLLVRRRAIDELALEADPRRQHPGRLLHYMPERPRIDPMGRAAGCNGPAWLTQAVADFRIDTPERLAWLDARDGAELAELVADPPPFRPDVTIDLTSRRFGRPVWQAPPGEDDLDLDALPSDLAGVRVTLGGGGDPLLHPRWQEALDRVRAAGVMGVHVETDLLCDERSLPGLLEADVISVHLPAMTAPTYAAAMGHNGLAGALSNLARLMAAARRRPDGGPVIVPTLVKLATNIAEIEAWYDQWVRAAGWAVVRGPDAFNLRPVADPSSLAAAPLDRTDRQPLGTVVRPRHAA